MKLIVMRLAHRIHRDHRISTHVALVSRAFGADGIIFSGEKDDEIIKSTSKVVDNWGGPFTVSYEKEWMKFLRHKKGEGWGIVHFTMYGLPYQQEMQKIRDSNKDWILVVGGEKVPGEMYRLADYNISVTSQPQSEVGALAVFLHDFFQGKELEKQFSNAKVKLKPNACGKSVIREGES